ncbi:hypothetical protein BGX29_009221 [Mortierella sp. GBA35]|nr:hypothetical protein BGX29_009221 [Mortierella sp. GBA35]
MLPWRPLGMLTFGLTIIFLFVRLHGDGYEFPVKVAECKDTLDFPRPGRTFLEISRVYYDDYWDWPQEQDQDGSIPVPPSSSSSSGEPAAGGTASSPSPVPPQQQQQQQEQGNKFGVGWSSQWHLGKKKLAAASGGGGIHTGRREAEEVTQETYQQHQNRQGGGQDAYMDQEQWIWMTNVWFEDANCGSGYLRQYRRRMDRVMESDNTTTWELMYTHRFLGVVTHTSLSKRIFPEATTATTDEEYMDGQERTTTSPRGQESIRLAIVYKVVQNEHVTYHARVYHFGVFQRHVELRGSSHIKDFSLEHDTIYYSRLSDTVEFRSLTLPRLKEGATSPERPFSLTSGVPGRPLICKEKRNMRYRHSFLTKVPSVTGRDPQIMLGQVTEDQSSWTYQTSISTETTELMTGHKRWLTGKEWRYKKRLPYQENDLINDETNNYGVPIQMPYFIKSADGSSIHFPIADTVVSLEMSRLAVQQRSDFKRDSVGSRDADRSSSLSSVRLQRVGAGGGIYYDSQQQQQPQHQYEYDPSHGIQPPARGRFRSKGAQKSRHWVASKIDVGALDTITTELGVINDSNDILVLKTTLNGVIILRRGVDNPSKGYDRSEWRLAMIMSDGSYSPLKKDREVLAMKIVTMPALAPAPAPEPEPVSKHGSEPSAGSESEGQPAQEPKTGNENKEDNKGTVDVEPNKAATPGPRNILLMVFGDGKIVGYDLEHATESSSAMLFLQEKYPAVIGMLVVVATFVINEARYAIAHP